MPRWVPIAAVVLALLGVVAYGVFRPGTDPGRDPADVQTRLNTLPRQLGPWGNAADDPPLSDRTVSAGRFDAYLGRTYTQAESKEAVAVLVVYGEAGDVGTHDPSLCYAGVGYESCGAAAKVNVAGADPPAELWTAEFRKRDDSLRVYWGWTAAADWRAADNPRFAFAGHRRLYKLYVQHPASSPSAADFLPRFLSALNAALTSTGPR